jgi:hypothetical protein
MGLGSRFCHPEPCSESSSWSTEFRISAWFWILGFEPAACGRGLHSFCYFATMSNITLKDYRPVLPAVRFLILNGINQSDIIHFVLIFKMRVS